MEDNESGRDNIIIQDNLKGGGEPAAVKIETDGNGLLANPSPTKLPAGMNPSRRKSWFSTNKQDKKS